MDLFYFQQLSLGTLLSGHTLKKELLIFSATLTLWVNGLRGIG